jgi:DNA repair protein RadC
MRRMLHDCNNNLNTLGKWDYNDFSIYKGIGQAKASTIMAALELGKRRKRDDVEERQQITCSRDVYRLFHPLLCDAHQEEFWVLLLNQGNKVIDKVRISVGGIDSTVADVRTILREAIVGRATGIILVHNHPSGNAKPSVADAQVTQAVQKSAQIMNIRLADHLIICDGAYYSFADEGNIL